MSRYLLKQIRVNISVEVTSNILPFVINEFYTIWSFFAIICSLTYNCENRFIKLLPESLKNHKKKVQEAFNRTDNIQKFCVQKSHNIFIVNI